MRRLLLRGRTRYFSKAAAAAASVAEEVPPTLGHLGNPSYKRRASSSDKDRAYELLRKELDRLECSDREADFDTYSILLRQCINLKALSEGKRVHAHITRNGCQGVFLENLLVQMYGSCGSLADAQMVFSAIPIKNSYSWNIMIAACAQNGHLQAAKSTFDEMPYHGVVSWTALIVAHAQNGHVKEAIQMFRLMDVEGVCADKVTFVSILNACAGIGALEQGRTIHVEASQSGLELNVTVGTALITMYGKCRRLDYAKEMFDKMPEKNLITWTAMLTAYAQNGCLAGASTIFEGMPERNVVSWSAMVAAYAQNGYLQEAKDTFDKMEHRNVISWNTIIIAYSQNGYHLGAFELFKQMEMDGLHPDRSSFITILETCASLGEAAEGKRIHNKIMRAGLESNVMVANGLIQMYGKCGCPDNARNVFDRIPERNVVSWNAMVAAYAQNGYLVDARNVFGKMSQHDFVSWNTLVVADAQNGDLQEVRKTFASMPERDVVSWNSMISVLGLHDLNEDALVLFRLMDLEGVEPNRATCASVFEACANLGLAEARAIHSSIANCGLVLDVYVGTSLVNMYSKCESFEDAKRIFDAMPEKNLLSWTAMLDAYGQTGGGLQDARNMFEKMPLRDMAAWNAMIAAYAQSGSSDQAKELFQEMPERNVISWTAMISAYAQSGHPNPKEAYMLFRMMDLYGQRPNKVTFITTLEACGSIVTEAEARTIHAKIIESGLNSDVHVCVGLLNMYAKCGCLEEARHVFHGLSERSVVTWSTIIAAYAQIGHPKKSLELFLEMQLEGVAPTEVTFVNVLSACSHAGRLSDAWKYFLALRSDHGLSPMIDHYVCMADLLGRSGELRDAEELLETMPYEPNEVAWTALLSACQTQGDVKRGACVGEHIIDFEPKHSGPYMLMSNVYLSADRNHKDGMVVQQALNAEMGCCV